MFIRREFHPFNFRSKFDELIINFVEVNFIVCLLIILLLRFQHCALPATWCAVLFMNLHVYSFSIQGSWVFFVFVCWLLITDLSLLPVVKRPFFLLARCARCSTRGSTGRVRLDPVWVWLTGLASTWERAWPPPRAWCRRNPWGELDLA